MDQQTSNSFLGTEEQPLHTPTSDERTMAILSHILTLVANFVAPLIIWLIKKDESPYVAAQAKESLNFQITMIICFIVCIPLMFVFIGFLLYPILIIVDLILVIMATVKASENKLYKYPINFRIIK